MKGRCDMAAGPSKSMWIRMMIVMLALTIGTLGISGVRLAIIMIADSEFYQKKAAEQQLYDTVLTPTRGDIYDKNLNKLATSASVWTIYITPNDFSKIDDEDKKEDIRRDISKNLSQILQMEESKVYELTTKKSSYVIVKKMVEKPQADKIREYIAASDKKVGNYIGLDESTKRYYPGDSLASVVLGFVGDDNQGLGGLEAYYDTTLTGTPGRVVAAKKANGADMPFTYEKIVDASPGNSLVLTVDKYIQYVCEKYLDQAIIDNKIAERGACAVMNVNTGEILAMAIKGDYNPNKPFELSISEKAVVDALEGDDRTKKLAELRNRQWRNKVVSDTYEPGSVFKIITTAAALEENATSLKHTYNCPGYIVVAGQRYSCHLTSGHGTLNLEGAMSKSCNPAFITMGQTLGASVFSKYFDAFGLTKKTGIDLPGESSPVYHTEAKMGPTELASTSFGQTFKITPIQLLTAISATVNGGYLVQPHVVSEIRDSNNNVVETKAPIVKRQVVSKTTSDIMRHLMEIVVDGGGGKNAYVPGYRIGGKTGTSEKVAEMLATGQKGLYIGSFCGVAPMDNPEIAMIIMLDEPKGDAYYGGTISAPAGGHIMAEILPYLGYEPHYTEEQLKTMAIKVPDVANGTVAKAKEMILAANLKYKIVGNGDKVLKQVPASTQSIYKDGVVMLYTEESQESKKAIVPNFKGLTVSGANTAAANAGVNIEFVGAAITGSGITSYKQSHEAGSEIESGTSVTVYFRSFETEN
ncbi:MAG: penicillin-binding transpeptidase domain-containing protein [Oscillospiraceae bacterium]